MNLLHNLKIVPVLLIGCCIPFLTLSQIAMPSSVLGNGGGITANSQYQINGTVAQTLIGVTANAVNQKLIGFWYLPGQVINSVEWVAPPADVGSFRLGQAYPNPAVSFFTIPFSVPYPARISLYVANAEGRIVGVAAEGDFATGAYEALFDASGLAAGVYYCLLHAEGTVKETGRVVVGR